MSAFDAWLIVFVSAAPISELRGAIPLALARGATPAAAFFLALAGNLLVIPLILFVLRIGETWIRRVPVGARLLDWAFGRIRRRENLIQRYGPIGLVLLVAIPFPGTGAWTGAIAAHVLAIPWRRAIPLIAVGVVIAGVLVLLASVGLFRL
ncbi:small multi-drug export protein, partial [Candidatus Bipolaricaulota bacterium]|nr:small multi-drug export protein [Candidatus Bipolaricaulota bacterium]